MSVLELILRLVRITLTSLAFKRQKASGDRHRASGSPPGRGEGWVSIEEDKRQSTFAKATVDKESKKDKSEETKL